MSRILDPSIRPIDLGPGRQLAEDAALLAEQAAAKARAAQNEIATQIANAQPPSPYAAPHRMAQFGCGRDPDNGGAADIDVKALYRLLHAGANPPDPMRPVDAGGRVRHPALALVELVETMPVPAGADPAVWAARLADLRAKAEAISAQETLNFCGALDAISRDFFGEPL